MFIGYFYMQVYYLLPFHLIPVLLVVIAAEITGWDNNFFCLLTVVVSHPNLKQTHYNFSLELI